MTKKYLLSIILSGALTIGSSAVAHTNCDNQPKPAFDCPTGYSMMCIPVGGDHWGCGKESNGIIIESSTSTSANSGDSGVQSTTQTQIDVKDSDTSSDRIDALSGKVDAEINGLDSKIDSEAERQTPKRDFGDRVKVTVRGWDADKKEQIEGKVATELENNPGITSVDITETNVSLNYLIPAKLFRLFPIKMNTSISADADRKVKVKFPWYRFLVKTDFANAAQVLNGVFQNNQSNLEFLKTRGSAEAQVEIFITISKTMHEMSKSIIQNIRA